jgi:hypothetical protein
MSDNFRGHENMKVLLPRAFDSIKIPELFITIQTYKTGEFERNPNGKFKRNSEGEKIPIFKNGWFIDRELMENKVLNKTRNISSRDGEKLLELETAKVDKITTAHRGNKVFIPRLKDFPSIEDRREIYDYLTHLDPNEIMDYHDNKTRGLPPILPKNWKKQKLGSYPKGYQPKEVAHEDIFGSDIDSDNENEVGSSGEGGFEEIGKKSRGRPRKHMTTKEAYDAKIKSNKDKRAERAKEARRKKIKEKLAKGEKLTKKERELHEAEGGEIKPKINFEEIHWGTFGSLMKRFLKKNPEFKDKIEDLEHFAHFVVSNPNKFSKIAHKKALFYQNILEHKNN